MLEDSQRARIQRHRLSLNMSPEQYGVRIGVSGMTVRRVERGYVPFLSTQGKFAAALGCSREDLFGVIELPDRAVAA